MAKAIIVKLNLPVSSGFGPVFNLTADVGSVSPSSATLSQLTAGFLVTVDDAATQIVITSTSSICPESVTLSLPTCRCHEVEVTGTVTLTYTTCDGELVNANYSNITVKICARLGSISKTGTGTINVIASDTPCVEQIDCWDEFLMEANEIPSLLINQIASTGVYAIEWEPGVYDIYGAGTSSRSYTYSSPYTGYVKIKAPSLSFITKLILTTGSVPTTSPISLEIYGPEIAKLTNLTVLDIGYGSNSKLYADTSELSSSLITLRVYRGILDGDIANLASTITDLGIYGASTVFGNIQNLPPNLKACSIYGTNTVGGDLANLPTTLQSTLKLLQIEGSNTVSGDIGELGGFLLLETFRFLGGNTITGDIAGISTLVNMKTFDIFGKNRLLGNISAISGWTQCTRFTVGNPDFFLVPGSVGNELTGDISSLPASMVTFWVYRYNTIGGDISSIPAGMTSFDIRKSLGASGTFTGNLSSISSRPLKTFLIQNGTNTFTGDVSDLPATITDCWLSTNGIIFGDIANIPPDVVRFTISTGNASSIFTYTPGRTWASPMVTLDIYTPSAPGIPTFDDLLIDLDASTWQSVTLPSTWGLRLKGSPVSPAAVAAAASITATPTNVTFY